MQPREIGVHPLAVIGLRLSLILDVDQKERFLLLEAHLRQKVYLATVARRDVAERLFVQEFNRVRVDVRQNLGKKQVQEFSEEGRNEFFEQPVVIDHDG